MRTVLTLLLLAVWLAGCATGPQSMRYGNEAKSPLYFPIPPETPRYLYVGELTGESNFQDGSQEASNAAQSFFNWLVGLGRGLVAPVTLQRPQSGVTDALGRVYVTDVSRQAVFVFDQPEGRLHVWEMADKSSRFKSPVGIALGADGVVLVADAELGMVARLDRSGTPLEGFGADVLKRPTGIARDPVKGLIYVADSQAHDIKVFDDQGQLTNILGQRGNGDGEFNSPTHLAFANDNLYVTDTLNSRVQIIGQDDFLQRKFGERGLYVGNLVRPKGVTVDGVGNIYVVESLYDTLLVFRRDGALLLAMGGTGKQAGNFYLPAGVWADEQNRIYVADMFNGRVVLFQYLGDTK